MFRQGLTFTPDALYFCMDIKGGVPRLRSAFAGTRFTRPDNTGVRLQNCPFFHKPRAPAGKQAHFVLCTIVLRRNPMTKTCSKTRIHNGGGALMIAYAHRFEA